MASYLKNYEGCATNRKEKFRRAVESFLFQTYKDKELIIIADGCADTLLEIQRIKNEFGIKKTYKELMDYYLVPKQPPFSGFVRQFGIEKATGELCAYLDNDDYMEREYLEQVADAYKANPHIDWSYSDDKVAVAAEGLKITETRTRENIMAYGRIGTSSIVHHKLLKVYWPDGYGHDWKLIENMASVYTNYSKIPACGYVVCHIPGQIDL